MKDLHYIEELDILYNIVGIIWAILMKYIDYWGEI